MSKPLGEPASDGGLVPFELHRKNGQTLASNIVPDEGKLPNLVKALPTPSEAKQWIAVAVIEAVKPIALGSLPFKSAGEAAKVARDLVALAKDIDWPVDDMSDLVSGDKDDRIALFQAFRAKAEEKLDGRS